MSCFTPVYAVRELDEVSHRYNMNFTHSALDQTPEEEWYSLPCRKCTGCRLDSAKEWAIRGTHELQYHEEGMFITLTYKPEFLPEDGSLWKIDVQQFNKRLRKHFSKFGKKLRVMYAGEYGKQGTKRPHYHIIVFGVSFDDLEPLSFTRSLWSRFHGLNGYMTYTSKTLDKLWPYGWHTIGEVNSKTIGYVARYVQKKIYGEEAADHYGDRVPEFFHVSNRPGIGNDWFEENHKDLVKGFITYQGHRVPVPKYYQRKLAERYPDLYLEFEANIQENMLKARDNEIEHKNEDQKISGEKFLELLRWRFKRNEVKNKLKIKQTSSLVRHYEEDDHETFS